MTQSSKDHCFTAVSNTPCAVASCSRGIMSLRCLSMPLCCPPRYNINSPASLDRWLPSCSRCRLVTAPAVSVDACTVRLVPTSWQRRAFQLSSTRPFHVADDGHGTVYRPTYYTMSGKKDRQYFGHNFDKFRQLFVIFGTNHPDNPCD